jgi:hypothetical protein
LIIKKLIAVLSDASTGRSTRWLSQAGISKDFSEEDLEQVRKRLDSVIEEIVTKGIEK